MLRPRIVELTGPTIALRSTRRGGPQDRPPVLGPLEFPVGVVGEVAQSGTTDARAASSTVGAVPMYAFRLSRNRCGRMSSESAMSIDGNGCLLECDIAAQAWVGQIDYCLTRADTAALLVFVLTTGIQATQTTDNPGEPRTAIRQGLVDAAPQPQRQDHHP